MLQLDESCTDRGDVALLVGECYSTGTFRIFQIWVGVYSCIAHSSIQALYDGSQLNYKIIIPILVSS